jgi:hypothetical protein
MDRRCLAIGGVRLTLFGMDISKHIQAIVDTLGTDAERIPLRRAVRLCLVDLDALRNRGFTWETIAARLTRAGARDKRGRAIAAHNLRTEYARLASERDLEDPSIRPTAASPIYLEPEPARKPIINSVGSRVLDASSAAPRVGRLAEILKTRPRPVQLDD